MKSSRHLSLRGYLNHLLTFGILMLLAGCATPTQPTGGPPDKTGPTIVSTTPESGTTNFKGNYVSFTFDKFVNRGSFQNAFSVDPDIGLEYKVDWGRKMVNVRFTNKLPDSTTVIFTLGTAFTDYHGNSLAKPFVLALSTGSNIDKGKLKGKVINADDGTGMKSQRILLYRDPFDLTKRASYIAETDTSGSFEFTYLKKGKYLAFWLDDRNRNKIWDRAIETAQPFDQQYVMVTDDSVNALGTIYVAPLDTVKPTLQGIGVLSSRRLRLRFSENIEPNDSIRIAITDTMGSKYTDAVPLYIDPNKPYLLYAEAQKDLDKNSNYRLHFQNIEDDAGNPLDKQKLIFQGSSQQDTTLLKIIEISSGPAMYPNEPLVVTYSNPIQNTSAVDSLKIVRNTKLITNWPKVEVKNNRLYVYPDSLWESDSKYQFRLYDPATGAYAKDEPKIWSDATLGGISIVPPDSGGVYDLHIENDKYDIVRDTVITGKTDINHLPPIDYTVRIFKDLNKNGKWDRGQVEPYKAPEPYFIQKGVPVKSKMVSELDVKFQSGAE